MTCYNIFCNYFHHGKDKIFEMQFIIIIYVIYIFEIKCWIVLWNCIYNSEMKIFYAYYIERFSLNSNLHMNLI